MDLGRFIEVYDNYKDLGILTRKITEGKEFDLVRDFIDYRKEIFQLEMNSNENVAVFVEPKINNSYPDIVFVGYDPENYSNWQEARSEINATDLKILHHIYLSKCIDATEIVVQLGVPWKTLLITIEKLCDSKLIIRKNAGWMIKDKKTLSLHRIEAVEAKINKIEEVFHQALLNKTFASESYILSNRKQRINDEKMNRFDNFGIGVYLQDSNGFMMLKQSQTSNIPVSYNSLFFNEWIGRIVNNNNKRVLEC